MRLALEEAGVTYDIIWINLIHDKQEWFEQKVNVGVGKVCLNGVRFAKS